MFTSIFQFHKNSVPQTAIRSWCFVHRTSKSYAFYFWLLTVSILWGESWCQNERKRHALWEPRAAGAVALAFMGYYRRKGVFGTGWGKNLMFLSFIFIIHFPSEDYPAIHTKFSKCNFTSKKIIIIKSCVATRCSESAVCAAEINCLSSRETINTKAQKLVPIVLLLNNESHFCRN